LDEARRLHGDRADRLAQFMSICDPLADECAAAFAELPPGRGTALLERALFQGIDAVLDAPRALVALFEQLDHVPAWVDWPLLDRGGELLLRSGPFGAMVLGFRSLVLAYAAPAGNKPLVLSGRLTEQAGRRLAETGRFVHVTCLPGSMRRFAEGFRVTIKVRLIHAQVRRLVRRSGKWNSAAWGEPVNQHDMLGTILVFSAALIEGLRMLGFRIDRAEADAYIQLWRYSGWLLGVDPELLPASEQEAMSIGAVMRAMQGPPDDDARALVGALFSKGLGEPKSRAEAAFIRGYRRFAIGLSRMLVGDEIADAVGLPKDGTRFLPALVRPALGAADLVRERSGLAHRLAVLGGDARWRFVIGRGLDGAQADFGMPERLGNRRSQPPRARN
jgi:hypothetical protein